MLGSGLVHLVAGFVPVLVLLSVVPQLFLIWLIWRMLTLTLPDSVFQKGDDLVFSIFQRTVVFFCEHVTGAQVLLYGDEVLQKKERVLYLANHQSDADWLIVHMLAARQGMIGQVRYILKKTIQMVPIFGFSLYQHGSVYVSRKYFNQDKMLKDLRYLKNPDIKSWVVLFPEGIRFNLAIERRRNIYELNKQEFTKMGLKPLKHVLYPRSRGMALTLSELGENFDAVYDVTTIHEGTRDSVTGLRKSNPTMFEFLRLSRPTVHVHIKRIEMGDVPTNELKLKSWLYELFVQKDRLLEEYYGPPQRNVPTRGSFASPVLSTLSKWETMPAFLFCITLWIPAFFYTTYSLIYWRIAVFGALGCYIWLGIKSIS